MEKGEFYPLFTRTEPSPSSFHLTARAPGAQTNVGVLLCFLSDCAVRRAQRVVLLVPPPTCGVWKWFAKERRTGPLLQETLVRFEDDCV